MLYCDDLLWNGFAERVVSASSSPSISIPSIFAVSSSLVSSFTFKVLSNSEGFFSSFDSYFDYSCCTVSSSCTLTKISSTYFKPPLLACLF